MNFPIRSGDQVVYWVYNKSNVGVKRCKMMGPKGGRALTCLLIYNHCDNFTGQQFSTHLILRKGNFLGVYLPTEEEAKGLIQDEERS